MKKVFLIPILVLSGLCLAGCVREQAVETSVPRMTIRAEVPDTPLTKASFSVPGSGTGLHLAWQAGDNIRVINGSNSAVYDIQAGFTDHVAHFSGDVVAGDYLDVVAPGSYTSIAAAEAGNPTLTQNGNGSTAHLVFTAMLGHVSSADLPNIAFSDDWVTAHPGTSLKRGGIVKFVLTLPDALTAPQKVTLTGLGNDVSVNITGVSLTSAHVLTAYAQCGWDDVAIPASTNFTISVLNEGGDCYAVTKTIPSAVTLMAGAQNIIIADGFTEQLFAGGDGSQANPYLLANARQLDNMHQDGVLKHGEKVYFRLIDDIDMADYLSSHSWVPLNKDNPYDYAVDLDGGTHVIDHFTLINNSTIKYPQTGFFGLLYGDVHDLTFTNATVNNSYAKPTGILCGFCGYSGKMAHVYNVHVNGNITYSNGDTSVANADTNGPVGGLAGRIHTCLIESCSAFDMNIRSPKAYSGGLFGYDAAPGSTVLNCWTSGIIGGDSSHGGNLNGQRTGGICGGLINQHTAIINCFSTMSVLNTYAMGGIVGHANLDKANSNPSNANHPTQTSPLNTRAYQYYRFNCTAICGDNEYIQLGEIEFYYVNLSGPMIGATTLSRTGAAAYSLTATEDVNAADLSYILDNG